MLHNRTLSKKTFAFQWKYFSGRVVKTAINLSRKKTLFSKKIVFFKSFSVFQQNLFGFLEENFKQVCLPAIYVSRITSSGFFAEKKPLTFLDINWNIIGSMAKFYWQGWQKWILSVHEIFLKEFDSAKKNFFIVFGHRAKQKDVSGKIFKQDCENCIFEVQGRTLIEHIPWRS